MTARAETITPAQARRTALAAQGLARRRPARPASPQGGGASRVQGPPGPPALPAPPAVPAPLTPEGPVGGRSSSRVTMAGVQRVVDRLGLLQIDSVNVLARAHLVPLYSRLGPYDTTLLDRAAAQAPRRVVETWAHVASYVPVATYPYLAWRRAAYTSQAWGSISSVATTHPEVVAEVREVVAASGPVTASEVQRLFEHEHPRQRGEWGWNWSVAKRALELLFFTGEVAVARRNAAFERCYDLTERVLPASVLATPVPDEAASFRYLLAVAARALGVGSRRTLADYFRLKGPGVARALAELVEDGELVPAVLGGTQESVYLHRDATFPRVATARTLLSPFDPLVFERTRLESLFGLRYRIEIYVPAAQRVHGYYVLPFLQGERLTARVDLKADRAAGVLRVESAHAEPTADAQTPAALGAELRELASWLALDDVVVAPVGDLAPALVGGLREAV